MKSILVENEDGLYSDCCQSKNMLRICSINEVVKYIKGGAQSK